MFWPYPLFLCRGQSFRSDYLRLGELRSIVPSSVNIMALTATASHSTRTYIFRSLGMLEPAIVYVSPQKKNVVYSVRDKGTITNLVKDVSAPLLDLGIYMPRMIIFCRKYDECSSMYRLFKNFLGERFTHPPNSPDLAKYRLVDMYTRCTEARVKEEIVHSFSNVDGNLRVVIGTIAFGMGIDSPNVRLVVHWGPSTDIESYIQETGRGGRDGYVSQAVLFHSPSDYRFSSQSMVNYCTNTVSCCRQLLFREFDDDVIHPCTKCLCCNVCQLTCKCQLCSDGQFVVKDIAFLF